MTTAAHELFATPAAAVACSHCSLEVPRALVEPGAREQFCCQGCRTVFAILKQAGLEKYYRERTEHGAPLAPVASIDKTYAELDDQAFIARYTHAAGPGLLCIEFQLENLHCPACVWLVERLGRVLPAVVSASVDLGRASVSVVWPPEEIRLSTIARALASLGYPPHAREGADRAALRRREDRALLARIAVAGACFGNVMLMALALYSGALSRGGMELEWQRFFRWGSALVALPAVAFAGAGFFRGALAALRTRTPHMDLPIALGISAGFVSGVVNVVRGTGEVYFDSITAIVFLLLIGRFLQRRRLHAAESAAELLHSLAPSSARLLDESGVRDVPVETLEQGALLEVRAGDHFPADGEIVEGESSVDLSLLTGESRPESVGPGARVHAGTVNVSARLVVRTETTGQATRVGRLLASADEAARRRAPIALLADRAAGRFVLAVLVLSAATLALWWPLAPERAIENAIALLIVTCPCALGLATPLSVSAALGKAARSGILVKGGDALERLASPALVIFDKTGTLTQGRLELCGWDGDLRAVSGLVSVVEARSAHPIAQAMTRALGPAPELELTSYRQTPGGGIEAEVGGRAVCVGSVCFVGKRAFLSDTLAEAAARAARAAQTPVLVAVDGTVLAVARFEDPLRSDARRSLLELQRLGHRIAISSGDGSDVVRAVVDRLGVELEFARGGMLPEDKLELVERESARGPVVMVGDGVNDAAALARADVGIAVHGGAEASLAAADVFTTRPGVLPVLELFQGARRTLGVIRRNLLVSLGYNLVCATLAVAGLVAPWIAAILMPLSSLTVVTAAHRSRTFQKGGT